MVAGAEGAQGFGWANGCGLTKQKYVRWRSNEDCCCMMWDMKAMQQVGEQLPTGGGFVLPARTHLYTGNFNWKNHGNTVLPEWTQQADGWRECRRAVWLCGHDEPPGREA